MFFFAEINLQGIPSGADARRFGTQGLSRTVPRDNDEDASGGPRDNEAVAMKELEVTVDVAAGIARVTGGDPAAAAGLEILCHGRRMVILKSSAGSDVRWDPHPECIIPRVCRASSDFGLANPCEPA